jgi:lathosterol oxidase
VGGLVDYFLHLTGQLVVVWLVSLTINLFAYVVVTAGIFYALRFFWKKGLEKYKIQQREASQADIRREIISSLRSVLIFSVIYAATYFGTRVNLFTVYPGVQPLGMTYLLASTAAIMVAHDTYFYWFHRLMHHRLFFRRFHRTHHKSVTPTVFACYALDGPEALLIGCFVPLWLLAVPMQLPGLVVAATLLLVRNAIGHCGVELFSSGLDRSRWFGWLSTNTDHDLHHSMLRYNYGFCFSFWDRLMGTDYRKSREQAREMPVPGAIEGQNVQSAEISF